MKYDKFFLTTQMILQKSDLMCAFARRFVGKVRRKISFSAKVLQPRKDHSNLRKKINYLTTSIPKVRNYNIARVGFALIKEFTIIIQWDNISCT